MKPIFYKELQSFFSHPVGYLILGTFLTLNALLLWFFKGYSNVILTGFAHLNAFFSNSSWVFLFLIPAMTMKSFADEYQQGTIELLKTLPLKSSEIILGKFFAYACILFITLLLSCVFVYSVYQLGNPVGNIDLGSTFTSYFGLLLLACFYIAIGMFCSILTQNNITSFILASLINAIFYFGFTALENLSEGITSGWHLLGVPFHFDSMSRGVIALSDIMYFISLSFLFLGFTHLKLQDDRL
ncbi:ABC transporter permease subunit [Ochrovirga pacifica]|uniref:ABC transporter permease subunit n=1 Tax=Ochrovirga pacifica TaxID=1042376 RepID=UPI000255A525|nr:ABC transporter permease subunit [Ochrovirga pacifica]